MRNKEYPDEILYNKGKQSGLWRAWKNVFVVNGHHTYKEKNVLHLIKSASSSSYWIFMRDWGII